MPLYLMDTNIPENPRELQDITDQLYGGDRETRIRQELVLGRGRGARAARHGHPADGLSHERGSLGPSWPWKRVHTYMQEAGVSFREALEAVRAGSVFTTHTPVLAGFDLFAPELMEKYFGDYLQEARISRDELLALGRANASDPREAFNMAVLALRTSAYTNGVSKLHGQVSRGLFPEVLPAGARTGGAHHQHHQWHPPALLDFQRDGYPVRPLPGSGVVEPAGRGVDLGEGGGHSLTRNCGRRTNGAASG